MIKMTAIKRKRSNHDNNDHDYGREGIEPNLIKQAKQVKQAANKVTDDEANKGSNVHSKNWLIHHITRDMFYSQTG